MIGNYLIWHKTVSKTHFYFVSVFVMFNYFWWIIWLVTFLFSATKSECIPCCTSIEKSTYYSLCVNPSVIAYLSDIYEWNIRYPSNSKYFISSRYKKLVYICWTWLEISFYHIYIYIVRVSVQPTPQNYPLSLKSCVVILCCVLAIFISFQRSPSIYTHIFSLLHENLF